MKMTHGLVERSGDRLKLSGRFFDNLRRPANVKLLIERGPDVEQDDLIVVGDLSDVSGTLNALAELAWKQGWRPRGIQQSLMNLITNYKEPREGS